ncbi:MAG TPA: hypothetical protein VF503_28730 [Sphingobium sp.]|uniref:hypothetical protein n=1 Tax=Sphingobium sp. TaxID=1912891 RepID=UPI002ED06EC1
MLQFIFYLIALIATCIYIGLYGGRTGRWSGAVLLIMALISAALAMTASSYVAVQPRMLACDTVSLILKVMIVMRSSRRWPVWVAAFQFNTVLAGVAIMAAPAFRNEFYFAMSTIWAAPTLIVMVTGTMLDRRYDERCRVYKASLERYVQPKTQSRRDHGAPP